MLIILLFVIGIIIGSLTQRMVGGGLSYWVGKNVGSFIPRTLFALFHGIVIFLLTNSMELSLLYGIGMWIGCTVGMWSGLGMGRISHTLKIKNKKQWLIDFGYMTFYGFCKVAIPTLVAFFMGLTYWWVIVIAGLLCGLIYEFAYRFPLDCKFLQCQGKNNPLGVDPPPTAELIFGSIMFIGTFVAGYFQSDKILSIIEFIKNML